MGDVLPFRRSASVTDPTDEARPVAPAPAPRSTQPDPLWREVSGEVLREQRGRREQTLAEVAARAGISIQYLSEIERGRKEPSSEVLAAVTGALDLTLLDLSRLVVRRLTPVDLVDRTTGPLGRQTGPVALAA